jgi:acyl dehydratase
MPLTSRILPFANTVVFTLEKPWLPLAVFARGGWRALFRSQGKLAFHPPNEIVVTMNGVVPDPIRLSQYRRVCGYPPDTATLPPTFLETLFLSPLGKMVTSKAFPLSPAGLIHVGQTIIPRGLLPAAASYNLTCRTAELKESNRGYLLTVALTAAIEERIVWQGKADFLSRSPETIKGKHRRTRPDTNTGLKVDPRDHLIDVPARTGWQYARASADYNPHHLNRITALPLGYKRPIAHGMWSLARCLSEIEKHVPLAAPYTVLANFKAPLFMPAVAAFSWTHAEKAGTLLFRLTNARQGQPHVIGMLKPQ